MFLSAGKQKKTIMKSNQNTKWDNTFKQKAILKHKYIAVIYSMCVAFRPIIKQKKNKKKQQKNNSHAFKTINAKNGYETNGYDS